MTPLSKIRSSGAIDQRVRPPPTDLFPASSHLRRQQNASLTASPHTDSISQIVWDPRDEHKFVSVSLDKTCKMFDTRSWPKPVYSLPGTDALVAATWSPDGVKLAVTSKVSLSPALVLLAHHLSS